MASAELTFSVGLCIESSGKGATFAGMDTHRYR